jgi:HSP20 family molecular chaperone IbpA
MIDRDGAPGRGIGLHQLTHRMLEDAFGMPREGGAEGWGAPAVHVYEEGDTLIVEAQLPGTKPDDIDVQVERGVLNISGRTETEREQKERNYLAARRRLRKTASACPLGPGARTRPLPRLAPPGRAP